MNEKIQAYLDKKAAELRKDEEERRRELLIEEGLCERVYAPEGGQYSEEAYPEWDSDKGRAYRIEPTQ